jgi:tryptophan-rich sensory protein
MMEQLAPHWGPIGVGVVAAIIVALAGGLLTDIGPWYAALKKPAWKPPDWAFGPVWTTIFALCVASGVIAWSKAAGDGDRTMIIALFTVNGLLNMAWSLIFFTLRRPDWALIEVLALWLSILALIIAFWRLSAVASLLLLPYIAWVSIASLLNWRIVQMNGPFGQAG